MPGYPCVPELQFTDMDYENLMALQGLLSNPNCAFDSVSESLSDSILSHYPHFVDLDLTLGPYESDFGVIKTPKFSLSTPFAESREVLTPPEISHKRKARTVEWCFRKKRRFQQKETAEEENASSWDFAMTVDVFGAEREKSTFLKLRTIFTRLSEPGRRSPNIQLSAHNIENDALNNVHSSTASMQPIIRWFHELLDKFQYSHATQFNTRFLESANYAFQSASNAIAENRLEMFSMKVSGLKTGRPYKMRSDHMIHLTRTEYKRMKNAEMQFLAAPNHPRAYIALGSNVGDRVGNIESACRMMSYSGIKVLRTSALYETNPMYYEDQGTFINGVCEVNMLGCLHNLSCSLRSNIGRDLPQAWTATTAA